MKIIPVQQAFDEEIPADVRGNSEYAVEVELLQHMDRLLTESGAEEIVIGDWLARAEVASGPEGVSYKDKVRLQDNAIRALRAAVLRKYRDLPYRDFARELALAPLYQWFCRLNRFAGVKIPSKSTLHADEQAISEDLVRNLVARLSTHALAESGPDGSLGTEEVLDTSACFFDTFCLQTNIHYPVDWVLLRDASRTLMLAVMQIRKHGIVNRMTKVCPRFVTEMNRLCIEMTHSSRQKDGRKKRKRCFRDMKKQVTKIEKHARRHLGKLYRQWQQTDLSEKKMQQIADRIEHVLEQLPEAIHQGHERVIGGRTVKNEEKILSLYEDGVNVIVRHKAGANVEFGNKVSLLEQKQGLILDWNLARDGSPGDPQLCCASYDRVREQFGPIGALATDRGCNSARNTRHFERNGTYDATCPRNIAELSLRMNEDDFQALQKRRGSTEARISILQKFTGGRLKCKSYEHRKQQFSLCVLTHNVWHLARLMMAGKRAREDVEASKAG